MIKVFTQNDLIKFLYHETSEEESKVINKALLCDAELKALFTELKEVIKQLDEVQVEPSSSSVLNILNYSQRMQEKRA